MKPRARILQHTADEELEHAHLLGKDLLCGSSRCAKSKADEKTQCLRAWIAGNSQSLLDPKPDPEHTSAPGRTCDAQHHAAQFHPAVIAVAQQEREPEGGAECLQNGWVPVDDVVQPNACACRRLDPNVVAGRTLRTVGCRSASVSFWLLAPAHSAAECNSFQPRTMQFCVSKGKGTKAARRTTV